MKIDEFKTKPFNAQVGFEIVQSHLGKYGHYEAYYSLLDPPDDPKADLVFVLSLIRKRGAR